MSALLKRLGIALPIIQAPDGRNVDADDGRGRLQCRRLGSIGVGAADAAGARDMIEGLKALTSGPFNVNVFTHRPLGPDFTKGVAARDVAEGACWSAMSGRPCRWLASMAS